MKDILENERVHNSSFEVGAGCQGYTAHNIATTPPDIRTKGIFVKSFLTRTLYEALFW